LPSSRWRGTGRVLRQVHQLARPQHLPAECDKTLQQHLFRHGLRHHQGVRVGGGQLVERDRHQHAVAVADREALSLQPASDERGRDTERLKHLERSRVDHGGPEVLRLHQPVMMRHARRRGERRGERQSGRTAPTISTSVSKGAAGARIRILRMVFSLSQHSGQQCWQ
jgi:hypothetical protein